MNDLLEQGIYYSSFREPMEPYNNSITAVCTEPISGEKRAYMRKFQLYRRKYEQQLN